MNLETKITIYKFTPQVFTLTRHSLNVVFGNKKKAAPHTWKATSHLRFKTPLWHFSGKGK